jgi:hypothetical protein
MTDDYYMILLISNANLGRIETEKQSAKDGSCVRGYPKTAVGYEPCPFRQRSRTLGFCHLPLLASAICHLQLSA